MQTDIWSIFACKDELDSLIRDQYGRAPHVLASHSPRYPAVSAYLHQQGFRPTYPEGKEWAVLLSHDVDWLNELSPTPQRWLINQAKHLLKGEIGSLLKGFALRKSNRVPAYDLKHLLEAHDQRNIRSTFFFLALEEGELDFNYEVNKVQDQLDKVIKQGSEIGLHGGHLAYDSKEKMAEEAGRLKAAVPEFAGYRNHYLRLDIPTTWRLLQELGFSYDATFGYAGFSGFRNGMCYPFRPYDGETCDYMDITVLPLHVMDVSLFNYLGLDPEGSFDLVRLLAEEVRKVNGVFSLLWHNNYMTGEWGKFYLKVLDYLVDLNPYFAPHNELLQWWKKQGYEGEMEQLLEKAKGNKEGPFTQTQNKTE